MYRITTVEGLFVGFADTLNFIRKNDNGIYIPVKQPKAQGIAYNSVAYNLMGHDEIDGETVIIGDADFGGFMNMIGKNEATMYYMAMMLGVQIPEDEEDDPEEEIIEPVEQPIIDQEATNNA